MKERKREREREREREGERNEKKIGERGPNLSYGIFDTIKSQYFSCKLVGASKHNIR